MGKKDFNKKLAQLEFEVMQAIRNIVEDNEDRINVPYYTDDEDCFKELQDEGYDVVLDLDEGDNLSIEIDDCPFIDKYSAVVLSVMVKNDYVVIDVVNSMGDTKRIELYDVPSLRDMITIYDTLTEIIGDWKYDKRR